MRSGLPRGIPARTVFHLRQPFSQRCRCEPREAERGSGARHGFIARMPVRNAWPRGGHRSRGDFDPNRQRAVDRAHDSCIARTAVPQSGSTAGSEGPVECKCAGDGSAPAHCRGERNAGHTSVPERRCAGVADERRQRKLCVPGSGGDPFGRFLPRCSAFALTRRKMPLDDTWRPLLLWRRSQTNTRSIGSPDVLGRNPRES